MRTKKHLGQHFLSDENIAIRIVESLTFKQEAKKTECIEIGPGKGILTKYLIKKEEYNLTAVEFDIEAVEYLKNYLPDVENKIENTDILKYDMDKKYDYPLVVIGNIPYNISAPIFFKVIENRDIIAQTVFMIQKEVAERIAADHGSKKFGILSVLLQAYYDIEYLFTVGENVFDPPPKVKSAVIRLTKTKKNYKVEDYKKFKRIVKQTFGQRRKMLRNTLKNTFDITNIPNDILTKRPEHLSVAQFIELSNNLKIVKK